MITYSNDPSKFVGVQDFYKENSDIEFQKKYTDKTCDKESFSTASEKPVLVGLKKQSKRVQ